MRINEIIVVEGKNDENKIKSIFDVDIIVTNGSEISDETLELIKKLSLTREIIVFTDPDYPGLRIRNKIQAHVGKCKHAFIDKNDAIKNNKVGIEKASKETIIKALNSVVTFTNNVVGSLSYFDIVDLGLVGKNNSVKLRNMVCKELNLGWCNAKTFLKRVNMLSITKEKIQEVLNNGNNSN